MFSFFGRCLFHGWKNWILLRNAARALFTERERVDPQFTVMNKMDMHKIHTCTFTYPFYYNIYSSIWAVMPFISSFLLAGHQIAVHKTDSQNTFIYDEGENI